MNHYYAVLEDVECSHDRLKWCANGADTGSFDDKRCPSHPVFIGGAWFRVYVFMNIDCK